MNRTLLCLVLVAAAAALALRLPRLDARPMHNDEAVNAVKFGQLWQGGGYKYDPQEFHGPALPYATWLVGRLTGAPDYPHYTEARLRLVPVLFGVGLILLLPLVADGLGRRGMVWAGFFTALSPAMVFYSRYYIHEMLLVFFTFLTLAAGWRYWRSRQPGWALLAGAGFGLMQATKETFVITAAAVALALLLNHAWSRFLDASGPPAKARRPGWSHLALAAGTALVISVLLFSSFFTNPSGPLDSVRTYFHWLERAGGASPHINPPLFYLHRLVWFHPAPGPVWTEASVLALALVATWAGFTRKHLDGANAGFVRFLSLYAFLLLAIYSLLPYKTPWCLLTFWQPMLLLAGVGAAVLLSCVRARAGRIALAALLLAAAVHLGCQSRRAAVAYAADRRNPYVYAQTLPDVLNLVSQVKRLAEVHPQGRNMLLKVIARDGDYWPLPWYLREFGQVGWWDKLPPDPFAPVMIVSANFNAALDESKTHQMPRYYQLRPGVFLELYVEVGLWRAYLAKFPPAASPE